VDAAVLADFPADGHALEEIISENEIACVIAFGEKQIPVERFGADAVLHDVVLDIFESELALVDGGESFDPIGDGELFDGGFLRHSVPPMKCVRSGRQWGLLINYSAERMK